MGGDGKFNIPFTAPTTPGTYYLLTTFTPSGATAPTASVSTTFTVSAGGGGGTTPTNITISFGNGGNGERHLSADVHLCPSCCSDWKCSLPFGALLHAWRLPLAPCMLQLLGDAAFHSWLCQIHILVLLLCACCGDWKMQVSWFSPVRCAGCESTGLRRTAVNLCIPKIAGSFLAAERMQSCDVLMLTIK